MIRATFIFFISFTSASNTRHVSIESKINATLQTKNISETSLLLDNNNFVSDNGLRRNGSKSSLRVYPRYFVPSDRDIRNIMLDVMRQSVYTTQERMDLLGPVMKKYENDVSFRMAFVFNRLRQLIIDLRRLFTVAYRWREKKTPIKRVYEQIYWYAHIIRKYFDVLYIVEHVIDMFEVYEAQLGLDAS